MISASLQTIISQPGRTAILGFGNRLWRDDGAGSVLAERLSSRYPGAPIFDAGMVPENFLGKVAAAKPDTILLVDAGDFGGEPGECRLFGRGELSHTGISTHAGSPRMLAAYLEARTGAQAHLLLIQTGDTGVGRQLTPPVGDAVAGLTEKIGASL
jgi:hydrogenase 3 maturation protease